MNDGLKLFDGWFEKLLSGESFDGGNKNPVRV
jgi:hypothetical protein